MTKNPASAVTHTCHATMAREVKKGAGRGAEGREGWGGEGRAGEGGAGWGGEGGLGRGGRAGEGRRRCGGRIFRMTVPHLGVATQVVSALHISPTVVS